LEDPVISKGYACPAEHREQRKWAEPRSPEPAFSEPHDCADLVKSFQVVAAQGIVDAAT
jgi:hypothetical protein